MKNTTTAFGSIVLGMAFLVGGSGLALAATEGVKSTEISVDTTNGVVTLIGVLDSKTGVEKAIAVAKAIKGVVSVDASGLKAK